MNTKIRWSEGPEESHFEGCLEVIGTLVAQIDPSMDEYGSPMFIGYVWVDTDAVTTHVNRIEAHLTHTDFESLKTIIGDMQVKLVALIDGLAA